MNSTDQKRLRQIYPVLEQLPPDLLGRVEGEARPGKVSAGEELFREGNPCTCYPLVVEGTIRATKSDPNGHEILLYRLSPGMSCVIAVVALLGGTSYPAQGKAETDVAMFSIPKVLFDEMILKSGAFRTFVFQSLSERLTHLMTLVDDVAFRRVDQRLASHLLQYQEPISLTHQMLADSLGTTREVVSRILESFQESGMLRLGRKRIEILNRSALERVHQAERD